MINLNIENNKIIMKRGLIGLFFILLVIPFATATTTVNTIYNDWVGSEPSNMGDSYIFFSTKFMNETKSFLIFCDNTGNISISRFDLYSNLENTTVYNRPCSIIGNSLNLWYYTLDEILFPYSLNEDLYLARFNLTAYTNQEIAIENITLIDTGITDFQDKISISTILTSSAYNSEYDIDDNYTIGIAYKKGSNLLINYDNFDVVSHSVTVSDKNSIDWDIGLSDIRKFYIFSTESNCIYFDDCIFHILFEGKTTQNSDRLGIYVREIYKGTWGYEFYDKGLIGFDTSYGFITQIQGIDYWYSTHHYPFLMNKIYFRAIQGNNRIVAVDSFDTLWNFEEEQSINDYGTFNITAFQPQAQNLIGYSTTLSTCNGTQYNLNGITLDDNKTKIYLNTYASSYSGGACGGCNFYGFRNYTIVDYYNSSNVETTGEISTNYGNTITYYTKTFTDLIYLTKPKSTNDMNKFNITVNIWFKRSSGTCEVINGNYSRLELFSTSTNTSERYEPLFTVTESYQGEIEDYSLFFGLKSGYTYTNLNNFSIQTVNTACRCNDWIYTWNYNSTHSSRNRACMPTGCSSESEIWLNETSTTESLTEGVEEGYLEPVVDISQTLTGSDTSVFSFANIFLTPFFLATIFMFVIAIAVSSNLNEGKGLVFLLVCFVMAMVYSIFGIYPIWLLVVFVVIAGLIIAKQFGIIGNKD